MDATTVQEIANQLGIGVDQILQYLPQYAQANFMGMFIPIMIGVILFIIGLIGFIISVVLKNRWHILYKQYNSKWDSCSLTQEDKEQCYKYSHLYDVGTYLLWGFGIFTGFVLLCLSIAIPCCVGPMIGWSTSPELMLLKSLIPM